MKKISNRMSVKQSSTLAGQRELLREHTNKINDIIDVVTEQQKEIKKGDLLRMQMIANLSVRINQIEHNVGLHDKGCTCQGTPVNPKPYTAMRSTGEVVEAIKRHNEYCECKDPVLCAPILDEFNCGKCHSCGRKVKPQEDTGLFHSTPCPECDKQQEDIREKIKEIIVEACTEAINDKVISKGFYADKILEIVKGE